MSSTNVRCPHCHSPHRQIKWGRTPAGSQKHRCHGCRRVYTFEPKQIGHPEEIRSEAIRLYREGLNCRAVARALGVHHQSVVNWLFRHTSAGNQTFPSQLAAAVPPCTSASRPARDPAVTRAAAVAGAGLPG